MITARTPFWARDDVIDRTLPIRTGRVEESDFLPDPEIYQPLEARRSEILSEVVNSANKMLGSLRSSEPSKCKTRMAEFEDFAKRACGVEEDVFMKLIGSQGELGGEQEDELVTVVVGWFRWQSEEVHRQSKFDSNDLNDIHILTSKLFKALKNYAAANDLVFTIRSSNSLGFRLRTIAGALRLANVLLKKEPHSSEGSTWTFRKIQ